MKTAPHQAKKTGSIGVAAIAAGMLLAVSTSALAAADYLPSIDPEVTAFYKEKDAEIGRLQDEVLDKARPTQERIESLRTLMATYGNAVIPVAEKLVKDPSPELASKGVALLGSAIVMSDHMPSAQAHAPAAISPYVSIVQQKHERAKKALRVAARDPRFSIAKDAAQCLASVSDEEGLQIIAQVAKSGVYSDAVAASITSLASPTVAAPHLKEYVEWASKPGKAVAIDRLARIPAYKESIRNNYLLNETADPELRKAAAGVLVQSGEDLLQVAAKADKNLVNAAAKSYIDNNKSKLIDENPQQAAEALQKVKRNIESLGTIKPDTDISGLKIYLDNASSDVRNIGSLPRTQAPDLF